MDGGCIEEGFNKGPDDEEAAWRGDLEGVVVGTLPVPFADRGEDGDSEGVQRLDAVQPQCPQANSGDGAPPNPN